MASGIAPEKEMGPTEGPLSPQVSTPTLRKPSLRICFTEGLPQSQEQCIRALGWLPSVGTTRLGHKRKRKKKLPADEWWQNPQESAESRKYVHTEALPSF